MKKIAFIIVLLLSANCFANRPQIENCRIKIGDKTFPLNGKVQVVNAQADIKIQVVNAQADIRIQVVNAQPTRCGQWQFVNAQPDLRVQFVDAQPDLKIQFVDAQPGTTR